MTEKSLKIKIQNGIVRNPTFLKGESADRDPYYTHSKIERYEKRIKESEEIRPRNKQLFIDFVKWLRSDATSIKSESRILKYYWHFWRILRTCTIDMDHMTRPDVEKLLDDIKAAKVCGGKGYSPATYADFQRLIKIFWKWLKGGGENSPDEVKWIRVNEPKNKVKAENIPTEQEIYRMRDAMRNLRDKALIMVMKETGWRIGEHLETRIKNVSYTNDGIELNVISPKTGELLWTLLIESLPWLQLWLENHPDKKNPETCLWVTTYAGNPRRMGYGTIVKVLKDAAKRWELSKEYSFSLLYLISIAVKDFEVTRLLSEKGYVEDQVAYSNHVLGTSNEDLDAWQLSEHNPAGMALCLAGRLKDAACIIALQPRLSERSVADTLRDELSYLPHPILDEMLKTLKSFRQAMMDDTFQNVAVMTKIFVEDLLRPLFVQL